METFTIQDMLINSTDLNQILCNFGIKNISDCGGEDGSAVEPKGKVNFPPFSAQIECVRVGVLCLKMRLHRRILNTNNFFFCQERTRSGHLFLRQCALRICFRSSGKELLLATHMLSPLRFCLVALFCPNPGRKRMQRKTKHCYDDYELIKKKNTLRLKKDI